MKLKINNKLISRLSLIILTLTFFEFLYTELTGEKTNVILTILFFWGLIAFFSRKQRFTKDIALKLLVITIVILYTRNEQSIRYGLTLAALFLWSNIKFEKLENYIRFLIVISGALSIVQLTQGARRIHGFFASSAPQMSCVFLCCECYLLVYMANRKFNKLDIVLTALCVAFNFFTGTRSTLIASAAIFVVYMIIIALNSFHLSSKKIVMLLVIATIMGGLIFRLNDIISYINTRLNRNDLQASSLTRMGIYRYIWGQLKSNMRMFLIGNGGGYIKESLMMYLSKTFYYPAHQDFLLIWAEYGIVGMLLIFWTFLRKHKCFIFFLMVFGVCSFHNVVLTPMTMILMTIEMIDIEQKQFYVFTKKKSGRSTFSSKGNLNDFVLS